MNSINRGSTSAQTGTIYYQAQLELPKVLQSNGYLFAIVWIWNLLTCYSGLAYVVAHHPLSMNITLYCFRKSCPMRTLWWRMYLETMSSRSTLNLVPRNRKLNWSARWHFCYYELFCCQSLNNYIINNDCWWVGGVLHMIFFTDVHVYHDYK